MSRLFQYSSVSPGDVRPPLNQLFAVALDRQSGVEFRDIDTLLLRGTFQTRSRYGSVRLIEKSTLALGQYLQSGYIEILDLGTMSMDRCLSGHRGGVMGLCSMSSVERINVASVSHDQTLRLWDVQTGDLVSTIRDPGRNWLQHVVRVGPNSVAVGGAGSAKSDRIVRVFDLEKESVQVECGGSSAWRVVSAMSSTYESKSTNCLFVGDLSGNVVLYDLRSDQPETQVGEYRHFRARVNCLCYVMPKHMLIAVGDADCFFHDLRKGTSVNDFCSRKTAAQRFALPAGSVESCALTTLNTHRGCEEFIIGMKRAIARFSLDNSKLLQLSHVPPPAQLRNPWNAGGVRDLSFLGDVDLPDALAFVLQDMEDRLHFMCEESREVWTAMVVTEIGVRMSFSVLFLD